MKNVKLLNKIAKKGTDLFDRDLYNVGEDVSDADAILVRSASMHEMTFEKSLKAIGRAGAGVNNIPLDRCAEEGIVVFNTPGANANAVKELAVCALFLASRSIADGIEWAKTLKGSPDVEKLVEKGKGQFGGYEITGKTLGIIGLGAIGGMLANAALDLGMKVVGCDPYLSVNAALAIKPGVKKVASFDEVFEQSDYISVHVPATPETKGFINSSAFSKMKDGVRILNLARADLVNADDMISALGSGKVASYVTDFPTEKMLCVKGVTATPHLGASTEEAEDNCAMMAARQIIDYLENGNIKNSVNYPELVAQRTASHRVCVLHANEDGLVSELTRLVPGSVTSRARGKYAYTVIDTDECDEHTVADIKITSGVFGVNVI